MTRRIVPKCKKMGFPPEEAARRARAAGISDLEVTKDLMKHYALPLREAKRVLVELIGRYPTVEAYDVALLPLVELAFRYLDVEEDDFGRFEETTGIPIKTDALARQGRIEEALRWRDRLDENELVVRPITRSDARALAAEAIGADDGELRILDDTTLELPFGWIFFYQSASFLETGEMTDMVGGNAPILVDRYTAVAHVTGTAYPIGTYIDRYEATGDPHRDTA